MRRPDPVEVVGRAEPRRKAQGVDPHRIGAGVEVGEGVVAGEVGEDRVDHDAAAVQKLDEHVGNAGLGTIEAAVAVVVLPHQVAEAAPDGTEAEVERQDVVVGHGRGQRQRGIREMVLQGAARGEVRSRNADGVGPRLDRKIVQAVGVGDRGRDHGAQRIDQLEHDAGQRRLVRVLVHAVGGDQVPHQERAQRRAGLAGLGDAQGVGRQPHGVQVSHIDTLDPHLIGAAGDARRREIRGGKGRKQIRGIGGDPELLPLLVAGGVGIGEDRRAAREEDLMKNGRRPPQDRGRSEVVRRISRGGNGGRRCREPDGDSFIEGVPQRRRYRPGRENAVRRVGVVRVLARPVRAAAVEVTVPDGEVGARRGDVKEELHGAVIRGRRQAREGGVDGVPLGNRAQRHLVGEGLVAQPDAHHAGGAQLEAVEGRKRVAEEIDLEPVEVVAARCLGRRAGRDREVDPGVVRHGQRRVGGNDRRPRAIRQRILRQRVAVGGGIGGRRRAGGKIPMRHAAPVDASAVAIEHTERKGRRSRRDGELHRQALIAQRDQPRPGRNGQKPSVGGAATRKALELRLGRQRRKGEAQYEENREDNLLFSWTRRTIHRSILQMKMTCYRAEIPGLARPTGRRDLAITRLRRDLYREASGNHQEKPGLTIPVRTPKALTPGAYLKNAIDH